MRDLPSGTVTFLFTDIEGSTKLLHELGPDGYAEALGEHRRILREAFTTRGGVEVDTQGDAFCVAFPGASNAVEAAEDAQRLLAGGPIHVRMGIHSGEPTVTEEGYVGMDVHLGARIAAAAHGDQVILSRRTMELADGRFVFTDLGQHRLKDLEQPVWIFQFGEQRFPPLKTLSNTNLPARISSFVGRERELQAALGMLERTRLLTVIGPGGAGKSRFALELATDCVPMFRHGVFWIPLAAVRDPALVEGTIAETIGAVDGPAAGIGDKSMLLVLDNFEQIVEAAPALTTLLSSCQNLTILVTSRESLRIEGELEFVLPPLPENEGVELFRTRASAVSSGDVAELVRRLDGLPLAIELAAARAKLLTVPQLINALGRRLDEFKGRRDADPRQQTLRATIRWSYDLLNPPEQETFARMAVFSDGFTLDAAEEIAAAEPDVVQSLLEKSMIRRTEDRFEMLETIREFALERFVERPDAEATRRRHAEYYTAMAELADDAGDDTEQAERRLEGEWGNLRAALEWACGGADPAIGLRLSGALWRPWWNRGAAKEGSAWYEAALEAGAGEPEELRALAIYGAANMALVRIDGAAAIELLEQALAVFRRTNDRMRVMRTLNDLGIAWQSKRDFATARSFHEESLQIAEELGMERAAWTARVNLAELAYYDGRIDDALAIIEDIIPWARRTYPPTLATVLGNRARIQVARGDFARARDDVRESIEIVRDLDEWRQQAHSMAIAAAVLLAHGDARAAVLALALCDALCEAGGSLLEQGEQEIYDRTLESVRVELNAQALQTVWTEARKLDPQSAYRRVIEALTVER